MSERTLIAPENFSAELFDLFNRRWLLLASGSFAANDFNVMTISWGFLGFIWQRPAAVVVVRPQRHTLKFMEKYDTFTLSAYPESMRQALALCGAVSGSQVDKIARTGLTPEPSQQVAAPSFAEAELVIECTRLYRDGLLEKAFADRRIPAEHYPEGDFHQVFVGGIESISGTAAYRR